MELYYMFLNENEAKKAWQLPTNEDKELRLLPGFFANKQRKYRIVSSSAESESFDVDKREKRIADSSSIAKCTTNGINNNHTDNNAVVVSECRAKQHSVK